MTRLGERTPTRAAAVADELRQMIRSGALAAGTRLRQDEIATRFGVSSTPVREALAVLAREGLVHHDAHRGAVVFPPTVDDVRENFEIRLALEPLATRLAAERPDASTLRQLFELLGDLDEVVDDAARTGDVGRYREVDRAFHAAIFALAGRPRLAAMLSALRDASAAYAHLGSAGAFDLALLAELHREHALLVAAIRAGDVVRAESVAAHHVWLTAKGSGAALDVPPLAEAAPSSLSH